MAVQECAGLSEKCEKIFAHLYSGRVCKTPFELASGTDALQLMASAFLSRRVIRRLLGVTGGSNHFDFHICAPRQGGNLDGGTGRGILFEIRAVCFVYRLKVVEVGEKNRGFDNAVESHSLSSQDG